MIRELIRLRALQMINHGHPEKEAIYVIANIFCIRYINKIISQKESINKTMDNIIN